MSRCAVICFEHDHRSAGETLPCLDLDVDVRIPWSWLDATIGEVHVGGPAKNRAESALLAFEGTLAKITALAERYRPACPACKAPLRYVAWSVEDYEDD
jgi:hypothetical protein